MKDMGKSMNKLIPFVPPCANIDTLSFRASHHHSSQHHSSFTSYEMITTTSSSSSSSSSSRSFSTTLEDPIESVISGLRSERLFFDPQESCSLVLDDSHQHQGKNNNPDLNPTLKLSQGGGVYYKESEALSMESNNPCEDFRRSMVEMVEAHGLNNDWASLEELLGCYLKLNDKTNHGYIMGAFIDLLVNYSFVSSTTTTTTPTTSSSSNSLLSTNLNCSSSPSSPLSLPSSSLTTPCLSSLLDQDDDDDDDDDEVNDNANGDKSQH